MAAEEIAVTAAGFLNKSTLEFVAIAVVAPIIASVVAVITARLGITGGIRRLELAEKRIDVVTSLLAKSDLDDRIRSQLRAQLHDITADLISEYGDESARFDAQHDADTPYVAAPIPSWSDLSFWRRYLFPPFTKGVLSWVCGMFYYYSFGTILFLLFGFWVLFEEGASTSDDIWFALVFPPLAYLIIMTPLRMGMKSAFNKNRNNQTEKRRVSDHAWSKSAAT